MDAKNSTNPQPQTQTQTLTVPEQVTVSTRRARDDRRSDARRLRTEEVLKKEQDDLLTKLRGHSYMATILDGMQKIPDLKGQNKYLYAIWKNWALRESVKKPSHPLLIWKSSAPSSLRKEFQMRIVDKHMEEVYKIREGIFYQFKTKGGLYDPQFKGQPTPTPNPVPGAGWGIGVLNYTENINYEPQMRMWRSLDGLICVEVARWS